jgi:nitrate reductase delta subunit
MIVDGTALVSSYRMLAELLLYPEERQEDLIRQLGPLVESAPDDVRTPLLRLLADPAIHDCGSYIEELEITRNRPLYLGFYLFDEPDSCQSAGTCGRNGYMIELSAIYRHYGLELGGNEMPDFLPLVLDFLALTGDRREGDESALRTKLIKNYVQPAVIAMHERFSEHGGAWLLAVDAVAALLRAELSELPVVSPTEDTQSSSVGHPSSTASLKEMP